MIEDFIIEAKGMQIVASDSVPGRKKPCLLLREDKETNKFDLVATFSSDFAFCKYKEFCEKMFGGNNDN